MALTHERNKNRNTRKGCILCYNTGSASPTYCYIEVEFIKMYGNPLPVVKQIGICFKHSKPKTEKNPNGILDVEVGNWIRTPFGKMAEREGVYQLVGGPKNFTLLTGPSGKIPSWW